MNPLFASLVGSASLCFCVSLHIALNHAEVTDELTEWFLNRIGFAIPFYITIIFIGVLFRSAGRRGSKIYGIVINTRISTEVANFYASAAGATIGWSVGICVAAIIHNPKYFWGISFLAVLAFIMLTTPLVIMTIARSAVENFSNRFFREMRQEWLIRQAGNALILFSIVESIYQL